MPALSAFMFFNRDTREKVKKEMPDLQFLEASNEIGRRWRQISDEERRPYDEMAAASKRRYQDEKKEYVNGFGNKKDPNAPKRAMSAYFYFCNDIRQKVRDENPNKSVTEIPALLAEKWRALPDEKRTKYEKMRDEDKTKYQ